MVKAATGRGWTRTAMALVWRQSAQRATLMAERQQAAERLFLRMFVRVCS
jgi:type I site-specific restriction endonuclease